MSKTPRTATEQDVPEPSPIITIERRVTVAEIVIDPWGEVPVFTAAFTAVAVALGESLTDERSKDRLEFVYLDHRFTVSADPMDDPATRQ